MYLFCGAAMMLIQGGIVRRLRQGREINLAYTVSSRRAQNELDLDLN
jgi:hypothetical protein